jgi:hypothetical protein
MVRFVANELFLKKKKKTIIFDVVNFMMIDFRILLLFIIDFFFI